MRTIKNTNAFKLWSSSSVEEREKIIKEKGSKEEERQEAEVKQCSSFISSYLSFTPDEDSVSKALVFLIVP